MCFILSLDVLAEHLAFICFPGTQLRIGTNGSVLITQFEFFPGSAWKYPSQHNKKANQPIRIAYRLI